MAADRFDRLAGDIVDGRALDWDTIEAQSDPAERGLLAELRVVATVAAAHRAAASDLPKWGLLRIVEEVGHGAFGVVYRAFDPQLARDVALKVMNDAAESREIVREGRLLARIRHPNIVTVHGADVHDGRAALWMEFVDGRTLEEVLHAHGPFGAGEAAVIGRTLCGALAAVHAAGLVHGDVKAQNVMREHGGRVVLMDFGAGNDRPFSCDSGRVSATPVYAAPELLDGAPPEPRSDIYSLGVLLFHLVTGRYPVPGATLDSVVRAHRDGLRVRLRDLRPDLAPAFVEAVETACAADPARRHASAGELDGALGRVLQADAAAANVGAPRTAPPAIARRRSHGWAVAGAALLATAAMLALPHRLWPWPAAAASSPGPLVTSIAVLAIDEPRNYDPAFARGLTAAVSAALARLQGVKIVAAPAAPGLRTSGKTPGTIARDLGVEALLDASLERTADSVVLSVRLIGGESGRAIWSDRFTRSVHDVALLQHALARALADSLRTPLAGPAAPPRVTPEAYDAYLHARGLWNTRNREAMLQARDLYQRAVALDPSFATAYAGLANCYTLLSVFGIVPKEEAAPKARAAAKRALELDPGLSEAYTAIAYSRIEEWDWPGGEQAYRRAIELNPNDALAHHWYGLTIAERRPEEAVAEIERAAELDPLSKAIDIDVGMVYMRAGRVDDAIAHLKRVLTVYPDANDARLTLGEAYIRRDRPADAALEFERVLAADPVNGASMTWLGACYQRLGRKRDAQVLLARAHAVARTTYLRPAVFASLSIAAGDVDQALRWIERGVELREDWASGIPLYPWMAPLRGNPRFEALVKRVEKERRY